MKIDNEKKSPLLVITNEMKSSGRMLVYEGLCTANVILAVVKNRYINQGPKTQSKKEPIIRKVKYYKYIDITDVSVFNNENGVFVKIKVDGENLDDRDFNLRVVSIELVDTALNEPVLNEVLPLNSSLISNFASVDGFVEIEYPLY